MRLTLQRTYRGESYTIGRLYVDGTYVCDTLEDKDRGLKKTWPIEQIRATKVYGLTAIPLGTYTVEMGIVSAKFASRSWAKPYGGKLPRLYGVPGFDGVLIHVGNVPDDTLGCVLVGRNTVKGQVTSSTATFYNLMDKYLVPAYKRGETITITIQ